MFTFFRQSNSRYNRLLTLRKTLTVGYQPKNNEVGTGLRSTKIKSEAHKTLV